MLSIAKKISRILNNSLKATYPFPDTASIHKNDLNPDYDYYSDISILLFSRYKDKMLKLWGAKHTPPTPQSYSEEILTNVPFKHGFLHRISHDFDGKILFTLDNRFIEGEIRKVVQSNAEHDQGEKDINNMSNVAVVFPFGEALQKLHLNQMRGINISESLARIYEHLGFKVRRFSCLRNCEAFHGILLGFLAEKELEFEDKSDLRVRFEDLSRFLVEKRLSTPKEIGEFGAKALAEVADNERSGRIFAKANAVAMEDMLKCYNAFIAGKSDPLSIVDCFNLNRKLSGVFRELSSKGKIFYSEEGGFHLTLKSGKTVRLIDNLDKSGVLTKEGVFLGFLYEISAMHL